MSYSFDRYDRSSRGSSSRRGVLNYWVPLALTVTVATIGVAAWVWSERSDDDDEDTDGQRPPRDDYVYDRREGDQASIRTAPPAYGTGDLRPGEAGYGTARASEENSSYMARMSGALRRTPSPQQFFDGASKTVVAGVAAAGAVVSSALASIREEDKDAFRDHETWSQEDIPTAGPDTSSAQTPAVASKAALTGNVRRKTVAIVLSADAQLDFGDDDGFRREHASILSHLPRNIDFSKVRLFVLIYSPNLKEHPLDTPGSRPAPSLDSSYSNIGHDQAYTPTGEGMEKSMLGSATPAFNAVYSQAQELVEKDTMILPFTTPTGHVHLLRHINPEVVYLQESLAGQDGEVITHLQTWLRHDVIVVVGSEGGDGGLADSESELDHGEERKEHWWEREDRVGLGRGVVVVDSVRMGDDWGRRIQGWE